ncbi:MAG: Lar family restriction alleviation protein [Massiliimalia sp.]|jgi:hypothetical protein
MTELERRALLGDEKAQEECTDKGIILPCPFCKNKAVLFKHEGLYGVRCTDTLCIGYDITAEYGEQIVAIGDWNARPAPPIGKCGECAMEDVCLNCTEDNGFCSDFVSKDKYK